MTSKTTLWRVSGVQRKLKFMLAVAAVAALCTSSVAWGAFFDTAGQSARAMGMGEVFLASSTDASGYWYNPAGLAKYSSKQLGIGYGKPSAFVNDLMTSQINFVTPMGENSGIGLGVAYGGISEANEMVLSGAYGVALGNLTVGGNVKILRWAAEFDDDPYSGASEDDLSKVSFSLDLSAGYSFGQLLGLDEFMTGVYVRDAIMPNISESGDDGGKLPIEAGIGVLAVKNGVSVGGDVAMLDDITIFRVGAESGITGSDLKVRGGFVYGSDFEDELEQADFSLGLGYMLKKVCFDYAYNIPMAMKETGGKHYVSFGFSF